MKEVSGFNKTLRHLAIALMCVFAVFAVLPAGIGAKTGLIVKAEAATSKTCVVGQAGRFTTSASGTLRWSSSKPSVLKVTQSGQFTALKAGTATVTLSINGRKRGTCYVTVKRNILRFKTSSGGRNSGFYTVMQDGTLKPSFCIKPVYIEFLSRNKLSIRFQIYNFSTFSWTKIGRIREFYVRTKNGGTVLINVDPLNLKYPFQAPRGQTVYRTFTFTGSRVKNFVDLTKAGGIVYSWDVYLKDSWR